MFLDQSLLVHGELPEVRLSGYIVDAVHAKSSRMPQELFVNQRPVRNAAVLHAIMDGYGTFLPRRRQPQFVLFLEVDPSQLDVNVHPTKREVRFVGNEAIHQLVRRAVRHALSGDGSASGSPEAPIPFPSPSQGQVSAAASTRPPFIGKGPRFDVLTRGEAQLAIVSEAIEPCVQVPSEEVVALGQLNRTYLVVRIGGDLTVLDQHTAHERVLFERLYRAWNAHSIQSQPLLIPQSIELSVFPVCLAPASSRGVGKAGTEG